MDESHQEKIARIDANVQHLLGSLPVVQALRIDSEKNKLEHKWLLSLLAFASTPAIWWACKKLGIPIF